jgi:hypothetical protein
MHGPIRLSSTQTVKRLGLLPAGRRRSLTPPNLARLSLVDFSEYSIESSDAAEAGAKCNFRQRQVRLVNELLSPLHGLGNLNWTRSDVLLKQSAQMTGADSKPWQGFPRCPHQPRPYGSAGLSGRLSFVTLSMPERTALFRVGI